MNKEEFILSLRKALSGIGSDEAEKSVDFYTEIIEDAIENGEDELEAVKRLGSVDEIAQKIINETPLSKVVKERVRRKQLSRGQIILICCLSPIWFPILVSLVSAAVALYASLWSLLAALFAVFAAFALTGLALLVTCPFMISAVPVKAMLAFGVSMFMLGSSVFLLYIAVKCAKGLISMTICGVNRVKNVILKGGSSDEEK